MTNVALSVSDLQKSFGGLKAVDGVSFDADYGTITGLIGPNGAGKSTLFNLITGDLKIASGCVSLNNIDVTQASIAERLRLGIARTFQDVRLLNNLSVIDNVASAPLPVEPGKKRPSLSDRRDRSRRGRAAKLLLDAGLSRSQLNLPAETLSYGDQKLVSFARCLFSKPSVMLLDEPTSGLDEASLERFFGLLHASVSPDRLILLVEHNMRVVRRICDQAVVLAEGRVYGDGPPEELMKDERLRKVYFGS